MVTKIIDTMSLSRFDTYLFAAGRNRDRALDLYIWNATLGASFHLPIQAVEVALRNRINHALVTEFGSDWWKEQRFLSLVDRERQKDLDTVKARLHRKQIKLETGQIVAGLSFGFWVGMLQPKYNPPIWGRYLKIAFPDLPGREGRDSLFKTGGNIAKLRNRISHHEPLIKEDALSRYSEVMKMLAWICPETEKWIRPQCDVPKIVRSKP